MASRTRIPAWANSRAAVEELIRRAALGSLSPAEQAYAAELITYYRGAALRCEKAIHRLTKRNPP